MKLHENQKDFSDLLTAASEHLKINELYLEKDYWLCFVLKNLSQSNLKSNVVFKGGTSLSKAHHIVKRFSEDVDLALLLDGSESDLKIKKMLSEVEKDIALPPLTVKESADTSKGSRIRKTRWEFPKVLDVGKGYGDASESLLLEINSFGHPTPYSQMPIETYLTQFLRESGATAEIAKLGLDPISIQVLSIERTVVEKLAAIVRACFNADADLKEMKSKIRHIYDLTLLMANTKVKQFLASDDFQKTIEAVRSLDRQVSKQQAQSTDSTWSEAVVFENPHSAMKILKTAYEGVFSQMLYQPEERPSISEIEAALTEVANRLRQQGL